MPCRLRDFLAIQEPEQIPEAGEADQALGVQGRTRDLAGNQNWRAHPGSGGLPMLDDFGALVQAAFSRLACAVRSALRCVAGSARWSW